jgi:hypothetical protein
MEQFECVTHRVRIRNRPADLSSAPRAAKPQVTCRRARAAKQPTPSSEPHTPSPGGNADQTLKSPGRVQQRPMLVQVRPAPMRSLRAVKSPTSKTRPTGPGSRARREHWRSLPRLQAEMQKRRGASWRASSDLQPKPSAAEPMAEQQDGRAATPQQPRQLRRPTSEAAEGKLAIEPPSGARHHSPRRFCRGGAARTHRRVAPARGNAGCETRVRCPRARRDEMRVKE